MNRDHLLRPGMFAAVRIVLPPEQNVVTVPETAVDKTLYGDSVFIIRQNTSPEAKGPRYTAERVFIKTGRHVDGRIAVLEGVGQGDLVITAGQVNFVSGMPVSLSPTDTLVENGKGTSASGNQQGHEERLE
jgi:membrane fusion protein, multidrug efflux system